LIPSKALHLHTSTRWLGLPACATKRQKCNMRHQRRGRTRRRRLAVANACGRTHVGWRVEKRERDCASASQPSAAAPRVAVVPGSTPARARSRRLARSRWTRRVHRLSVTDTRAPRGRPIAPGPPAARVRVHATPRAARPKPGRVAARNCYAARAPQPLGERKERGEHDGGPTRDSCRPRLAVAGGAHNMGVMWACGCGSSRRRRSA